MPHDHEKVPQGRAYAYLLPQHLRGDKSIILVSNGAMWIMETSTGLLCPLEAVCEKVKIPGVKYANDNQGGGT